VVVLGATSGTITPASKFLKMHRNGWPSRIDQVLVSISDPGSDIRSKAWAMLSQPIRLKS